MLGLYGSLIVEPKDGEIEQTDRDYTYILSEWDLELTPDVATGKAPRGPRDSQLRGGELGTDLFLMNGKTHEAIPPIVVADGRLGPDPADQRRHRWPTRSTPTATPSGSSPPTATRCREEAQLTKDTVWIAPGERYDLVFEANNPGVWMAHCHIENHAANGMMTVIQYEGVLPTGPLAEIWNITPATTNPEEAAAASDAYAGMHAAHQMPAEASPAAEETTPVAAAETPATQTDQPAQSSDAAQTPVETDGGVVAGANEVTIAMNDDRFGPTKVEITAGTTVTWVNQGANIHSVASLDGSFSSVAVMPGESFSYTYETPGEIRLHLQAPRPPGHDRQGCRHPVIRSVDQLPRESRTRKGGVYRAP